MNAPTFDLPAVSELTLWTKPSCPQCTGAKLGFKGEGVVPVELNITAPEHAATFDTFKAAGVAQAPVLQFPEVSDGAEVLFEAMTTVGNQVDVIKAYGQAVRELAVRTEQRELVAA
jgi:glutaredoxin